MTIRPITPGLGTSSNYQAAFNGKHSDEQTPDYRTKSSSGLKKVPVIVLMAMSPLNSIPSNPSNTTEIQSVQQSNPLIGTYTIKNGNEECKFLKVNVDEDPSTMECVGFVYNDYSYGGKIKGEIQGAFRQICTDVAADGTYVAVYQELLSDNSYSKPRFCRIPGKFGEYLIQLSRWSKNNGAIQSGTRQDFAKAYGKDLVNALTNLKPIRGHITKFYKTGSDSSSGSTGAGKSGSASVSKSAGTYKPNIIDSKTITGGDVVNKFNLISTDGNNSNFEEIEYIREFSGKVVKRAIVKNVNFPKENNEYKSTLEGLSLNCEDLSDYNCYNHPFGHTQSGANVYSYIRQILSSPKNNSGVVLHDGYMYYDRSRYDKDFKEYKTKHNFK